LLYSFGGGISGEDSLARGLSEKYGHSIAIYNGRLNYFPHTIYYKNRGQTERNNCASYSGLYFAHEL
jgi:hypothetical protein